jgi:hypothetical protein
VWRRGKPPPPVFTNIFYSRDRTGYCVQTDAIRKRSDPQIYRSQYVEFCQIVTAAILPSVTDANWDRDEERRVTSWQRLTKLPSTHRISITTEDPKRPRRVLTAFLNFEGCQVSPDDAAKTVSRFLANLLKEKEGSPLLHPLLIVHYLLSAIESKWRDLKLP